MYVSLVIRQPNGAGCLVQTALIWTDLSRAMLNVSPVRQDTRSPFPGQLSKIWSCNHSPACLFHTTLEWHVEHVGAKASSTLLGPEPEQAHLLAAVKVPIRESVFRSAH